MRTNNFALRLPDSLYAGLKKAAALRERSAFSAIRVEMDTVVWENGFDLAPEFLRAMAKPCVPA